MKYLGLIWILGSFLSFSPAEKTNKHIITTTVSYANQNEQNNQNNNQQYENNGNGIGNQHDRDEEPNQDEDYREDTGDESNNHELGQTDRDENSQHGAQETDQTEQRRETGQYRSSQTSGNTDTNNNGESNQQINQNKGTKNNEGESEQITQNKGTKTNGKENDQPDQNKGTKNNGEESDQKLNQNKGKKTNGEESDQLNQNKGTKRNGEESDQMNNKKGTKTNGEESDQLNQNKGTKTNWEDSDQTSNQLNQNKGTKTNGEESDKTYQNKGTKTNGEESDQLNQNKGTKTNGEESDQLNQNEGTKMNGEASDQLNQNKGTKTNGEESDQLNQNKGTKRNGEESDQMSNQLNQNKGTKDKGQESNKLIHNKGASTNADESNQNQQNRQDETNQNGGTQNRGRKQGEQDNGEQMHNLRNRENEAHGDAETTTDGQRDSNDGGRIFKSLREKLNSKGTTNTGSQNDAQSTLVKKNRNTKSKTLASNTLTGRKKVPPSKKKDFDKSFSSKSIVSFSGVTFNTDGSLTESFKSTLKPGTVQILDEFDTLFRNVMDYEGTFGEMAESLVQFIYKFTKMFAVNPSVFVKFFSNRDQLGPDEMRKIPLEFLASLKTDVLSEKMENLNKATKLAVCNRLSKKETTQNHVRKILQYVDCSMLLSKTGSCKNPISEVLAYNFEESKKGQRTLTDEECNSTVNGLYFCALSYKTIKKCPVNFLLTNLQRLGNDEVTMKNVFKWMFTSAQVEQLIRTKAHINFLKGMLHHLKPAFLKVIGADLIMSSIEEFATEAGKMDSAAKKAIGKIIINQRNLGDLRGNELLNALPFLPCTDRTLSQLNEDTILVIMDEIKVLDLDYICKIFFAEKDPDLQDTSRINNNAKFKGNKRMLEYKPASDLLSMDLRYKQLLDEGDLKDFKPKNRAAGRTIVDGVMREIKPRDLKRSDFKNFGKLIVNLDVEEVEECNKEEFAAGLVEAIKETPEIATDIEGPSAEKILDIMMDLKSFNLEDFGGLFGELAAKRLIDQEDSMYGDLSGSTDRNITCGKEQCPFLYEAFQDEYGPPGLENTNYTQTAVINLDNLMTGMTVSDMMNLPPTKTICELMKQDMTEKQRSILVNKVKYMFGLMNMEATAADSVTPEDIQECGEALKMFSVEDINEFPTTPTDLRQVAMQTITQTNLTDVSMEKIEEFASFYLVLMGREVGPLPIVAIEELGNLVVGLPDERYGDIEDEAIPDNSIFDNSPSFTESKCKEFVKAVKRKYNKHSLDSIDEDVLLEIGECITEVDQKELDQITDDIIEENEEGIIENVEKSKRKSEKLPKDKRDEKKKKQRRVKESVVGAKTRNKQRKRNRSRRSITVSFTCNEMQGMGSGVSAMTTAQITAMADDDFLDCANILGQYSDWTTNQIKALANVATRPGTFSTPSLWTADNVESAGVITQGLTPNELSTLTQLTVEAMFSIGRHDGWSVMQLEAGFARWLDLKGGLPGRISSTDLVGLGHFACGATTNHIDQMNATEYSLAANHIGRLTSCQEHQMEAFASLAKNIHAFGNISTWSTSVISAIGSVIGGLNAEEIGSLSTDQVAVIEPETIALIPSSAFVGFTADQLSSFSLSQSTAVTQNQQTGLSQEQLLALAEAGAKLYSNAHCLMIPAVLTIIPITLAYTFHL